MVYDESPLLELLVNPNRVLHYWNVPLHYITPLLQYHIRRQLLVDLEGMALDEPVLLEVEFDGFDVLYVSTGRSYRKVLVKSASWIRWANVKILHYLLERYQTFFETELRLDSLRLDER